jgi:hypothetical protein
MFAAHTIANRKSKDEAEKPFWISFADLMTALMILFLVVMCVALLAVTRTITEAEKAAAQREKDIELLLTMLSNNVQKCGQATVLRERRVIDFGPQATFSLRKSSTFVVAGSQPARMRAGDPCHRGE